MSLQALYNSIIVKVIESEESTYGSIIVPDMGKEKNLSGTVVAIGPGSYTITGEFLNTSVKVGDKVILPQMGPTKFDFEGEEYYICPEKQLLAIIND